MNENFCDNVLFKFASVIRQDKKISKNIFKKWGLGKDDLIKKINDRGLHGGAYSKRMSLSNLDLFDSQMVLNIGPEIGLEVFLLAEKVGEVIVCDPDEDNLKLIKKIARIYVLNDGKLSVNKLRFVSAGINNLQTSLPEQKIYKSLTTMKEHGLPTYYNVTSTKEIVDLNVKVDLIFVHKILSTISRTDQRNTKLIFRNSVEGLLKKLKPNGFLSWTEPEFMFEQNNINIWSGNKNVKLIKYPVIGSNEFFYQIIIHNE